LPSPNRDDLAHMHKVIAYLFNRLIITEYILLFAQSSNSRNIAQEGHATGQNQGRARKVEEHHRVGKAAFGTYHSNKTRPHLNAVSETGAMYVVNFVC
jgi:hypothetical protein